MDARANPVAGFSKMWEQFLLLLGEKAGLRKNSITKFIKKYLLFLMALAAGTKLLLAQPIITQQPTNQVVTVGGTAVFSVSVSGTGPFTYQWQFNNLNLPNGIISTVAGNGSQGYGGVGGPATNANLYLPSKTILDAHGNLFISDFGSYRILKVDTNGILTIVAGNGSGGYSGDGGAATNARIYNPTGIALDTFGDLFIVDQLSNRVRKVGTNGIITTVVGTGNNGYSGDGSAAIQAKLSGPYDVTFDATGNLFISDSGNSRIRKVDTNGIITTVAGNGSFSFSGDGSAATNASLNFPSYITCDNSGNLFISDYNNYRIRKVDTNEIITTFAGNGSGGYYSGDGGAATNASFSYPFGIAGDTYGNLFICDYEDMRVRKVNTNGIITTAAGNGATGYSGDGGVATSAKLDYPEGVAFDSAGNLFITDELNQRIRKVTYNQGPVLTLNNVAAANVGNYQVVVTGFGGSVTSSVAVLTTNAAQPTAAIITFSNLNQTYTGGAINVTASSTPPGLPVNLTYSSTSYGVSANAPTNLGSYTVIGNISYANYYGGATNTLVISQAPATVTLTSLNQTYDGTAKPVGVITSPSGLPVNVTYNGSPSAPTNAGGYIVIATINDTNYYGSVTNILDVEPPTTLDGIIWTPNGASSANWHSVASSADGSKLIAAVEFGGVYLSTNSGASWSQAVNGLAGGSPPWISVASSADGKHLGAVDFSSGVYISHNSGANWTLQSLPVATWFAVTVSADGREWLAAANLDSSHTGPGPLYISPNYGTTWVSNNLPLQEWVSVAVSADGKTLAAAARGILGANLNYTGPIYTSTNYGVPWRSINLTNQIWSSIACSADGSKLMAVALNGPVYVSTNSGTVWTPASSPIATNWLSVAASADGTKFTAEAFGGNIYTTTNLGVSWMLDNAPNTNWAGVTLSADGNKMATVVFGGGIYTAQFMPAPQLSLMPTNGSLGISWIIPSANFVLQQSSDLATTNWSLVSNAPVLNLTNLQNQLALPLPAGNAFYRLKTP